MAVKTSFELLTSRLKKESKSPSVEKREVQAILIDLMTLLKV